MKRYFFVIVILISPILLYNCHSSKKMTAATPPAPKITYATNIQNLVAANCSPCHIPSKGGFKKPLDTYAAADSNINEMLVRVQLNPGDKGFMPFKHAKLSDSTIALLKTWQAAGMPEN